MTSHVRRARAATVGLALLAVTAVPALTSIPASAEDRSAGATSLLDPDTVVTLGDTVAGLADVTAPLTAAGDLVQLAPTAAQRAAAAALGPDVDVLWNDAGTPSSVLDPDGLLLARNAGETPRQVAARWIDKNTALLGITAAQADDLEVINDQPLAGSAARAVLFRQTFGGLPAATGSMVTVGVSAAGDVSYVSTSLVKAQGAPVRGAVMSPLRGWLAAAAAVGRSGTAASAIDVGRVLPVAEGGWTRLSVPGFAQAQLARLRAYPRPDGTVRPAIEANVVDTDAGHAFAYRVIVDALDGSLLFRQNAVENSNDAFPFQGTYPGNGCSDKQPFELTDDNTRTIVMTAASAVPIDDITIELYRGASLIGSYDVGTSPEVATFSASASAPLPAGIYNLAVCSFDANQLGGPYVAQVTTLDTAVGTGAALPKPRWRAFAANPSLDSLAVGTVPTNTVVECWEAGTEDCSPRETHRNLAATGAWDTLNGIPTLTTVGNNANTHEAWGSFLTPGGLFQAPVSPTRDYTEEFTDAWNESGCNPANLVPGGNDIEAVTGNLFTGHNRVHDYSYYLGFTEENYNLQTVNNGRGGLGNDPEIGNVQAGAITGGALGQYMGRDNANQIALQDGVPGITNQYLFQPIAAAFYSPCTDGALDTGIYGHEYTHAISNRMVGGPDDGLTSEQGGAMGESWSDLVAAEYQFSNDYLSDPAVARNPWSLGSYTTGNLDKGIRDYAINDNPLNFSDYGFDTTGAEVHADGEIWNGVQWEVRQALVARYDAQFPSTDTDLQERCEQATATETPLNAAACPGNRRWVQLVFDAFLLQPGGTDMLQARNAMIAADQLRFRGANADVINAAYARRGMGADATTSTPADGGEDVTTPSFRSASGPNSAVTFRSAAGAVGRFYVGEYEARATPVADTDPASALPATAAFTPGTYRITYVSPTQGFRRFVLTVPATGAALTQSVDDTARNLAAADNGAAVVTSAGSGESLNAGFLIDGTEATNWGGAAGGENIDDAASQPAVAVALAGGLQTISSVKVSALLRPVAAADPTGLGIPVQQVDEDPLAGSRFTALRKFALQACTSSCTDPASYRTVFVSSDDAFPGTVPRPVAPDQIMRSFTFAPVQAAAVRLVALENQCTGQALYAGEQDSDPLNATDCKTASERGQSVHAAELQVFGGPVPTDPTGSTPGTGTPGTPTTGGGTSVDPVTGQPVATPSAPVAAPVNPSARPARARTKVRIRLPRVLQVRGRESTPVRFQVTSASPSAGRAGRVTVRLDGRKVRRASVPVTRKQGKKVVGPTYRVPRSLRLGVHRLQVRFRPTDPAAYTRSASRRITLTVVLTRPNVR